MKVTTKITYFVEKAPARQQVKGMEGRQEKSTDPNFDMAPG